MYVGPVGIIGISYKPVKIFGDLAMGRQELVLTFQSPGINNGDTGEFWSKYSLEVTPSTLLVIL